MTGHSEPLDTMICVRETAAVRPVYVLYLEGIPYTRYDTATCIAALKSKLRLNNQEFTFVDEGDKCALVLYYPHDDAHLVKLEEYKQRVNNAFTRTEWVALRYTIKAEFYFPQGEYDDKTLCQHLKIPY